MDLPRPLIQRLLRCPTLFRLQTSPQATTALQLHEASEYALRQYSTNCDQQHTVLIYPDGSLQNHKADSAWAFAVIHHDGHIPHYQGFATGSVTESITGQLQHEDFDSTKIELCAIIWSIIYCLQLPPCTLKEIHTDSESAIHFIHQFTHSDDPITRIAQVLFRQSSTKHNISLHHVPGHSYHPWNELADVLAKHHCMIHSMQDTKADRSSAHYFPQPPPDITQELTDHPHLYWSTIANSPDAHAYPTFDTTGANYKYTQYQEDAPLSTNQPIIPQQSPLPISSDGTEVTLRIGTWNAQRANVDKQALTSTNNHTANQTNANNGNKHFSRGQLLRTQANLHKTHLMAVQESTSKSEFSIADSFMQFSTPLHQSKLGCTLLASTRLPYATTKHKELYLKYQHFRVLHQHHRLLIIALRAPQLNEIIYVVHTPHVGQGQERQWWDMYNQLAEKWPPTILLGDLNAKMANTVSPGVGTIAPPSGQPNTDNDNAVHFRRTLEEHDMTALNTTIEHNPTHTLQKTSNGVTARSRIDYIAVHNSWADTATDLTVDHEHDDAVCNDDHYPIYVTLTRQAQSKAQKAHAHYDINKMQDPAATALYQQLLDQQPLPTWDTNPSQHHTQTAATIHQAAAKAFPEDTFSPRQPYVTTSTMKLIRLRRHVQGVLRADGTKKLSDLQHHLPKDFAQYLTERSADPLIYQLLLAVHTSTHDMHFKIDKALKFFLKATSGHLAKSLRQDRAEHVAQLVQQFQHHTDLHQHRAAWDYAKAALSYGPRTRKKNKSRALPFHLDENDNVITNDQQRDDYFLRHFAQQEHAQLVDNEHMLKFYNSTIRQHTTPENMDNIITLPRTTQIISHSKRRKAPSPIDHITKDLLKAAPTSTARHIQPLIAKVSILQQEPLLWKHGDAIPLHKGSGPTSKAPSYRSILLASEIPKIHYAFLRSNLNSFLLRTMRPTQCGGLPGRTTAYAAQ